MKVYFISGLGADERVFQKLKLPPRFIVAHIKWPVILKEETLESYALKIAEQINTKEPFIILGLSFGGMMAVELSKHIHPEKIILLSSISVYTEMPLLYRIAGKLGIIHIIPSFLLNKIYPFTYWFFGTDNKEEKKMLKQIIHDTDPLFLKWALREIINWQNIKRPENIVHIHGSADKVFPVRNVDADIIVNGGGHFMVYDKAEELNEILEDVLR